MVGHFGIVSLQTFFWKIYTIQGCDTRMKVKSFFAAEFYKGYWRKGHLEVFHFWPKLTHPAARSLCDS